MALKVEIYQRDIVRPFYPTPESLRNYKLSFRDQTAGTHFTPTLLFYNSDAAGSHHHDYDQLKESLSKTLSVLYPLGGRVNKDGSTIECNDKGVDFVRANVTNYDLADFVGLPKIHLLPQLLPRDPLPMGFDHSQPILAVQVNKFRCGGTAVATCLWHGVADAAAIAGFLKTWAAISRGEGATNDLTTADATKIFPPRENFDFSSSASAFVSGRNMHLGKDVSMKRFVFSKQVIEWMRKQHYVSDDHRRPSRVEALSAFIWAAVIRATLQAHQDLKIHMLIHLVDLRKRMNPPFPSLCLGNILHVCGALWENANAGVVTPQSLVGRIREATMKVTEDYVRKMQTEAEVSKLVSYGEAFKSFAISSVCGFPFRECDFGWGKPVWFVPAAMTSPFDGAYFFDAADGGIEVWMVLRQQVMSNLEKDNEFFPHVSCSQTVPELYPLPSHLIRARI